MTNEETARAINEELALDILDDPAEIEALILEMQAVLDRKLGKQ